MLYYKILHGHSDIVLSFASGSSVTRGNNFKLVKRVVLMSEIFYGNKIVDAWNSLPYTVVSASSINSFKRKLREVNLDRFLSIVE